MSCGVRHPQSTYTALTEPEYGSISVAMEARSCRAAAVVASAAEGAGSARSTPPRRLRCRASAAAATAAAPHGRRAKQSHEGTPKRDCWLTSWLLLKLCLIYYEPQAPSTGTLLKQPSSSEIPDFPTPRGYEQAVHPPFNQYCLCEKSFLGSHCDDPLKN